MRKYIVRTDYGDFETWAASPRKAVANIRWRIAGGRRYDLPSTEGWTVTEAA